MSEMNIILRNIITFVWLEGMGFNATLFVNGKKTALAIGNVSGGPIVYQYYNRKLFNVFAIFVNSLPEDNDPDIFIGNLVKKMLMQKDLKKQCKTKAVYAEKEGGDIFTLKIGYQPAIKQKLIAKYGQSVVVYNEVLGIPSLEVEK